MTSLRIGVVGLGFAGTAVASLLRRAGHDVTVYEEVATPAAIGAGIVLQPTGLAALAEIGVLAPTIDRGARLSALHCATPSGHTIVHLDYADLDERLFGIGMHRGALFEILYDEARRSGVQLHLGAEVVSIDDRGNEAFVVDADGARHGPHDLVIVANGAQSSLRPRHLVARRRPYAYGALWFVGRDASGRDGSTLRQVADGTKRFVGLLPSGVGPRGGKAPLVTLFVSIRMDAVDAFRRGDFGRFKADVRKMAPESDAVLEQIESADAMLPSSYFDVVLRRPYEGRVVCIGDAAHATSPQLGQGANLGLIDAVTFARALDAALKSRTSTSDSIARAARDYAIARKDAVTFYQRMSRWLTPFFQSDLTALGPLRDVGMRWACALPFFRRTMTATMAGLGRGVLRAPLALPPVLAALPARTETAT